MNPKVQPLLLTWLASLIAWLAARYLPGVELDQATALEIAGLVFAVGSLITHRLVTPLARPRNSDGTPLVPEAKPSHTSEKGYPPPDRPKSRIYQRRPPPSPRG